MRWNVDTRERVEVEMILSDKKFGCQAITFRAWFGVGPNEEIELSWFDAGYWIMRAREYYAHSGANAHRVINRIAKAIERERSRC